MRMHMVNMSKRQQAHRNEKFQVKDHSWIFNERRGNPHTIGQVVAVAQKSTLYTGTAKQVPLYTQATLKQTESKTETIQYIQNNVQRREFKKKMVKFLLCYFFNRSYISEKRMQYINNNNKNFTEFNQFSNQCT